MTQRKNRIANFCAFVLAFVIAVFSPLSAAAYTSSDKITLECSYDNVSISGMKWNVIKVADEKKGKYVLTDDFTKSGISLNDFSESEIYDLALSLQNYVDKNSLKPLKTYNTDSHGKITFNIKENGLYLFYSYTYEQGNYKYTATPILAVRKNSLSDQIYEPKFEAKKSDTANGSGGGDTSDDGSDADTGHGDNDDSDNSYPDTSSDKNDGPLPQTGMLWWPVPVLSVVGLLFVAAGISLISKKDKNDKE